MVKVKTVLWHKIFITLGLLALGAATLHLIFSWSSIPEKVPMHYNAAGEIDNYGSKASLLAPLLIGWILYGLLSLVSLIPAVWNTSANGPGALQAARDMLEVLKFLLAAGFSWMLVCGIRGWGLGAWFLPVFLCGVFGTIAVGVIRAVRKQ